MSPSRSVNSPRAHVQGEFCENVKCFKNAHDYGAVWFRMNTSLYEEINSQGSIFRGKPLSAGHVPGILIQRTVSRHERRATFQKKSSAPSSLNFMGPNYDHAKVERRPQRAEASKISADPRKIGSLPRDCRATAAEN